MTADNQPSVKTYTRVIVKHSALDHIVGSDLFAVTLCGRVEWRVKSRLTRRRDVCPTCRRVVRADGGKIPR